jgi:hypothetical protein
MNNDISWPFAVQKKIEKRRVITIVSQDELRDNFKLALVFFSKSEKQFYVFSCTNVKEETSLTLYKISNYEWISKYSLIIVITSKVISSKVITSKVITSNAITSKDFTSKVITTKVITSKVITSKVITSKVITSKAITSKAITSKVITSKVIITIIVA